MLLINNIRNLQNLLNILLRFGQRNEENERNVKIDRNTHLEILNHHYYSKQKFDEIQEDRWLLNKRLRMP